MDIRINRLFIENFKGVKQFTLNPNGRSLTVKGDNATGKTTLVDAFTWLLFGKDSQGKSDFEIKPIGNTGVDCSVTCELLVDDKPLTLKKVYKETWTKKRGSTTSTLTGHTTDHFVDGVPVQKKDWDNQIGQVIEEETFKMLTSPAHFNSVHWSKRRALLMEICGDIADSDVINGDDGLSSLPGILGNRKLDDHKKVIAGKKSEINKRLQELPSRIDELNRSVFTVSESPEELQVKIKELENKIADAKSGTNTSYLRKRLAERQAMLSELESRKSSEIRLQSRAIEERIDSLSDEVCGLTKRAREAENNIDDKKGSIERHEARILELREEYKQIEEREPHVAGSCPSCGQSLPEDQVKAATEKANHAQAERLAAINAEGRRAKKFVVYLLEGIEAETAFIAEKEKMAPAIEERIAEKKAELTELKTKPHTLDKELAIISADIADYTAQIEAGETVVDVLPLEAALREERSKLSLLDTNKRTAQRIEELLGEQQKISAEYEELERQLNLIERFIIRKVNLLEGRINSKFKLACFKLFETQINGGVAECCTTLYQGVPYGYGLNNGAEINVGLDIIRTVSAHYGVTAPVWLDNGESVTRFVDMPGQVIKLVVDENHAQLEVIHG